MKPRLNPPLDATRLREIWKASPQGSTERELLLEIARLHEVLVQARILTDGLEKAWMEVVGGRLVGLHQMRCLLDDEPAVLDWQAKARRGSR